MKRVVDFLVSFFGLLLFSPLLIIVLFLIWINDFGNPFYVAPRVGLNERVFKMYKLRSMIVNADKTGVDSTSNNDMRITKVGKFIRKFKLDEISQLINVLIGDMSLVGPRPNVKSETDLYTAREKELLKTRPGITDISSIVFSDEGEILTRYEDPDIAYNQFIRPWKSRLGLIYVQKSNLLLDFELIILTVVAIISKKIALRRIVNILKNLNVDNELVVIASRQSNLYAFPPPGAKNIVTNRQGIVD
jgi:lipopolysaccharide/colanic/teichoic acid biosynthesis glycosyltransferase